MTHTQMCLAKWGAGVAATVVALFFLMPQERVDGIAETWRRAKGDPGQACLDFERRSLKDPDSARLTMVSAVAGPLVTIEYRAKNTFGAYDQAAVVCAVDAKGNLNESDTRIARLKATLDRTTQHMDEAIVCLEKRMELRRELKRTGRYTGEADKKMGTSCPTV